MFNQFRNNFINLIMNKDQMYLTKIRELVKRLTIEQTANGYHVDQINCYILNSLKSHLMPPQMDVKKSTTFQSLIKQLITQSKISINELLQMIVQFLQNELMVACLQYTDYLQSQTSSIQTKSSSNKRSKKQKQVQKQLNPQQLEQFMGLKYLKNQKNYRNEDYYQRDYYDDYQNQLNRQMLEKILLNSQCKQQEINQELISQVRMGLVNDSENDNRVRKTNTTKKRLEYFTL